MHPLVPFVCRLPSRRILRVRGMDAHEFLQGIFTNDLCELCPRGSMYGCFLYFTGRVMCDAHLYQCKRVHDGQASILVDVDMNCVEELYDHLTEMKMRKKVVVENMGADLTVVAALEYTASTDAAPEARDITGSGSSSGGVGRDENNGFACELTNSEVHLTLEEQHTECFADPRNAALFPPPPAPKSSALGGGDHSTTYNSSNASSFSAAAASADSSSSTTQRWLLKRCVVPLTWAPPLSATDPYFDLLYRRGIGEGPYVFKNNKTLPFEGNLDFLKGVSFCKGCYIGQELTHRTHVMLVTRKRTVPLIFGAGEQDVLPSTPRSVAVGDALYSAEKEKIGEVTGVCGDVGVGLLRLRYVEKESGTVPGLHLKDGTPVRTSLPDWWPRKEVKKLLKNNA